MRAVCQRVAEARVRVGGEVVGEIGRGLCVLLGVARGDDDAAAERLAAKIARLRIFADEAGRFDRSLLDVGGGALVVSQFTLLAHLAKGRRPSFIGAGDPDAARRRVDDFAAELRSLGVPVETGEFGAHMRVDIANDGPVTFAISSDDWSTRV